LSTNTLIFDQLELKAKLYRGFGDINRLRIIELLKNGPLNVSSIVQEIKLSQPNISAHLRCLKDCQLVSDTRKGKEIFYELSDKKIIEILKISDELLSKIYSHIFACVNY